MAFSFPSPADDEWETVRHRPPVEDQLFRQAMSRFATGVTVVTTVVDGERAGFTASSFTSLSRKPPLVLVCLARSARSYGHFVTASEFAVSILAAGQDEVALLCASNATDKFAGDHFEPGATGLPLVRDALATFECQQETVSAGGDHVILIGRPWRIVVGEAAPLVNYGSRLRGCPEL